MDFEQELDLLIRSRYPIIYVATPEEERVEQIITAVAERGMPERAVHLWDYVDGFSRNIARTNPLQALSEIENAPDDVPALFVLRDFHRFLDDASTWTIQNHGIH